MANSLLHRQLNLAHPGNGVNQPGQFVHGGKLSSAGLGYALQTGHVQNYALGIALGLIVIATVFILMAR